jgi:tetratricopeptide (TPR) repeat protein
MAEQDSQNGSPESRAYDLIRLGDVDGDFESFAEAEENYRQAVAAFGEAIAAHPEDLSARAGRAVALARLGGALAEESRHGDAIRNYALALADWDFYLASASDFADAWYGKGTALFHLGNSQSELIEHEKAEQTYKRAIACFDQALRRTQGDPAFHSIKGKALVALSLEYRFMSRPEEEWLPMIELAHEEFCEALTLDPDDYSLQRLRDQMGELLGEGGEEDEDE